MRRQLSTHPSRLLAPGEQFNTVRRADPTTAQQCLVEIEHRAAVNEVRKRHFGESRPASTLVEVSALAISGALVEVDTVVHTPWG